MRKTLTTTLAMLFALSLSACASDANQSNQSASATELTVVTAFYPLTFVAEAVGGDHVQVTDLTPKGGEAHDIELSPRQVAGVASADAVFYLGDSFQPALEDAVTEAQGDVVDALDAVPSDLRISGDPHVWLNPVIVSAIGDQVAAALTDLDPDNAASYQENAAELTKQMDELDASFARGLLPCAGATLVTSHEAFGYLAAAYGLEQVGIAGLDPEAEPSPKRLAEIADILQESGTTTVFFESTDASQQRLAESLGVNAGSLATLESTPAEGDYVSVMQQNLQELESGLACAG